MSEFPVYESHVRGGPDYLGVAERFKPFDLPQAIDRSMAAAQEMTQNAITIQKNQAELNLMNVMAPLKVEEARLHVEAIKKQKEISDIMDAPAQLQAKADAERAKNEYATKQTTDATAMDFHRGDVVDLTRLAQNGDPAYFDKLKGMDAILGQNAAYQAIRGQTDAAFDNANIPDDKGVLQKGSYVRRRIAADPNAVSEFKSAVGSSRVELSDYEAKTERDVKHAEYRRLKFSPDYIDKLDKAEDDKKKAEIVQGLRMAENYSAKQGIAIERETEEAKLQEKRLARAELPAELDIGKVKAEAKDFTGRSFVDMTDHALDDISDNLLKEKSKDYFDRKSGMSDAEIERRIKKIAIVRRQIETVGFRWWKVFPVTTPNARWSSTLGKFFPGATGAKEMQEFMRLRSLAGEGKTKEAMEGIANWLWDFQLNKTFTQLDQRERVFNSAMGLGQPTPGLARETGGTAPAGGGGAPEGTIRTSKTTGKREAFLGGQWIPTP